MFDSLYVDCTCGNKVEFQSKAGDCRCDAYSIKDVPNSIAGDLIGSAEKCACGSTITLRGSVVLVAEVARMFGRKSTATDSGCTVTIYEWRGKMYLTDCKHGA